MGLSNILRWVVACVVTGAGLGYWQLREETTADLKVAEAKASKAEQLELALLRAQAFLHQGEWARAKAELTQLGAQDPTFHTAEVAQLMISANHELEVQKLLQECRDALMRGDLAAASRALGAVPADTAQGSQREALADSIHGAVTNRLADLRVLQTRSGDLAAMHELKAGAQDVLAARPQNAEARDDLELAESALKVLSDGPPPVARSGPPWDSVRERFASGDLAGAETEAEACASTAPQCATLLRQLREFEQRVTRAEEVSPAELEKLVALDRAISGGPSTTQRKGPRQHAAEAFMTTTRENPNWRTGALAARRALALDPNNTEAKNYLAQLEQLAAQMLGEPGDFSNLDEAAQWYRDIAQMTPPGDPTHEKAVRRLAGLKKSPSPRP